MNALSFPYGLGSLRPQLHSRSQKLIYRNYTTLKGTVPIFGSSVPFENNEQQEDPADPVNLLLSRLNKNLRYGGCAFFKLPASERLLPHVDDQLKRTTCIAWALSPEPEFFAPIKFYDENDNTIETVNYDENALLINTRVKHGVENGNFDRFSFQIFLFDPIDLVANVASAGKLFDKPAE